MKTETASEIPTLAALAASLCVTIESSGPTAGVDTSPGENGKPNHWPHIRYTVTLHRNGRAIWSGPYKLGTGHVKRPATVAEIQGYKLGQRQKLGSVLGHLEHSAQHFTRNRTHVRLLPDIEADIAASLAAVQNVRPQLDDVLSSLLMDGAAYFDAQRFEYWASDFGYSSDSITARETFDTCDRIGRDLARAFDRDELSALREAASNH
jgi:hypothetical protein